MQIAQAVTRAACSFIKKETLAKHLTFYLSLSRKHLGMAASEIAQHSCYGKPTEDSFGFVF